MHEHEDTGGRRQGGPDRARPGVRAGGGVAVRAPGRPGRRPRSGRAAARRRPCRVRPAVVPVAVRPAQLRRPVCRAVPVRSRRRLLVRRPVPVPPAIGPRVRRAVAAVGVGAAAMAVVVGLGLLAAAAAQSRAAGPPVAPAGPVRSIDVGAQQTGWDVARDVAPAASGAQPAAVVERIVTVNPPASVRPHPGQVLRVTAG